MSLDSCKKEKTLIYLRKRLYTINHFLRLTVYNQPAQR